MKDPPCHFSQNHSVSRTDLFGSDFASLSFLSEAFYKVDETPKNDATIKLPTSKDPSTSKDPLTYKDPPKSKDGSVMEKNDTARAKVQLFYEQRITK